MLLICGDFQANRNNNDLNSLSIHGSSLSSRNILPSTLLSSRPTSNMTARPAIQPKQDLRRQRPVSQLSSKTSNNIINNTSNNTFVITGNKKRPSNHFSNAYTPSNNLTNDQKDALALLSENNEQLLTSRSNNSQLEVLADYEDDNDVEDSDLNLQFNNSMNITNNQPVFIRNSVSANGNRTPLIAFTQKPNSFIQSPSFHDSSKLSDDNTTPRNLDALFSDNIINKNKTSISSPLNSNLKFNPVSSIKNSNEISSPELNHSIITSNNSNSLFRYTLKSKDEVKNSSSNFTFKPLERPNFRTSIMINNLTNLNNNLKLSNQLLSYNKDLKPISDNIQLSPVATHDLKNNVFPKIDGLNRSILSQSIGNFTSNLNLPKLC